MIAVGICALILWLIPIGYEYWWTWSVIRDIRNGQATRYSALGYAQAGPRAMRALREAVRSDVAKTRLSAVQALGSLGREGKAGVPELAEAARHDPDRNVRMFAAVSLGQIGPEAAEAVGPLIGLLEQETDPQVILTAVEALGRIGPEARAAIPVLSAMAKDPRHFAQVFAALALWRIGPEGRPTASVVVPSLINQLATGTMPRSRAWPAEVLAEMAPVAGDAIPALQAAEQDIDPSVRRAARAALEAIKGTANHGDAGEPASPAESVAPPDDWR
jgi:HEAT repeat protein